MRHLATQLCQAEVEDLDLPSIGDHDVGRLEVAMNDAGVMCRRHAHSDRDPMTKYRVEWQPIGGHYLLECPARDVLHRNRVTARIVHDVVDRDDVGMIQARRRLRFQEETPAPVGVSSFGREDLERDDAVEPNVARTVHLSHAAGAN